MVALALLGGGAAWAEQVIHTEKSAYRNILVYDSEDRRCMQFGRDARVAQTCISLANPDELKFDYYRMLLGALYLGPAPRRVLVMGLGGGVMVSVLQKLLPQAQIDTVEIDPAVVRVAGSHFKFVPGPQTCISTEDGRVFIKRALRQGRQYDLIVHDVFDHSYIPEHMITREYFAELHGVLAERGVIATNTFSWSSLYAAESATHFSVFGPFFNLVNPKRHNRVILARKGGLPPLAEVKARAAELDGPLRRFGVTPEWLLPLFAADTRWPEGTRVLTDKFAPANLLNGR
ncbi:spermidine synthase [Azohydromonas caseinilytica]|uniref:Fused MFS/spermidine synthase n=1 Tax=Azohydromonas caseinilytica TaxID=2728836 RepID=A0A848FD08_9BURK|nr:fused MFS/spermidine synthase [Azohydromonas caseinilytica]NML16040.1 fused MFS/spermidine synthase [Azohydromonas caseinilytica]